mmetsp:Transcript_23402/g.66282  ORF Transcript_23402/g.66282 Transcript_23402/m.66282 type:complete len:262 (-) Transcript_23402:218-1003(-)
MRTKKENSNDPSHNTRRRLSTSVISSLAAISGFRCSSKTATSQVNANPEPSDNAVDSSSSNVAAEMTPPCRSPIAAPDARPPSKRKMGRKLRADDINPAKPTTKSGWMGTGCAAGTSMALGANQESIVPTKKLDFNKIPGKTGNREMVSTDARTLPKIPSSMQAIETADEAAGPTRAMSNNEARLSGNDRSGVMQPNIPKCVDGTGVGRPIRIFLRRAISTWAISCTACIPSTPRKTGMQDLTAVMSFRLTSDSKNLGFSA